MPDPAVTDRRTSARLRLSAREFIDLVLDTGSWMSWDLPVTIPSGATAAYVEALQRAREATGVDEALLTGEGAIHGRRVAVAVSEFGFLGGSFGVAAADRLVGAVERATAAALPLFVAPSSGGTRMQEGTVAFVQMIRISAAVVRHKTAGLPFIVYLRHPTTGGVLASWGSLGHVTAAEPGALVGFLGPRVYEALYGEPFPPGVQVAENLFAHGLIDGVVPVEDLPRIAARALAVLGGHRAALPDIEPVPKEPLEDTPAWESIARSRRPERPGVRALLRVAATDVTLLSGTGAGETEPGLLLALACFSGAPCVVLGHDRRRSADQPLGPAGLRSARRGMRIARELRLPLVTIIDTAGAALSARAEESGLAMEIARCLADLVDLPSPTVCVLLGQGAGGAALALLPADRVLCAEHAWLSPLPPEGASAILHGTVDRAAEVAQQQGVRSRDLLATGIVDRIVAEHPDAADEPDDYLRRMGQALQHELIELLQRDDGHRLADRRLRFDRLGLV